MTPKKPLVWIVVLHWRGIEHTRACLQSLRGSDYSNQRVLLVDNGSETEDGQKLKQEFDEIDLLRLPSNLGFSGGCNAGMEYSQNQGAEFIWLLNNDATVEPNTLSLIVEAAADDVRCGAAAAAISERDPDSGEIKHSMGHGVIDLFNAKTHLRAPQSQEVTTCDWITGSNMLLRSEALSEVGLLNDDYFLYFEDVEICRRLKEKRWNCLLVPGAHIQHIDGASTEGKLVTWRYYYHFRNRLIYFSTYPNVMIRVYCFVRIMLHLARHCLMLPFRGEEAKQKLNAELRAMKDFLSGVRGRAEFN